MENLESNNNGLYNSSSNNFNEFSEKLISSCFRNFSIINLKNPLFSEFGSMPIRDQLISLIGFQPGLSCVQLTKIINSFRNKKVSNQLIFYTLTELANTEVLLKKDKKYFVNLNWVSKLKNTLIEIEEKSFTASSSVVFLI